MFEMSNVVLVSNFTGLPHNLGEIGSHDGIHLIMVSIYTDNWPNRSVSVTSLCLV